MGNGFLLKRIKGKSGMVSEFKSFQELQRLIKRMPIAVFKIKKDEYGEVINVFCQGVIARELGINSEEINGKNVTAAYPKELSDAMIPAFRRAFCGETVTFFFTYRGKEFNAMVKPIAGNAACNEIIGYITEFSEHKSADGRLLHYINHDQLTGLPNRILFYDRLHQAILHAEQNLHKFALLMFDLDRFKLINESLGHAIGDELLKAVADRIVGSVSKHHMVARIGGDGFALILEAIEHEEDVHKVAAEIINNLSKPYTMEGYELYVNTSVGISIYPNDGIEVDLLMKNADIALHQAKEKGSNTYEKYRYAMNSKNVERLRLENDLRRAIERKEFELYYQPQISKDGDRIIGMEALLRWHHPDLGIISPAQFIPLAEETGMIIAIGEWVLREACLQAKKWQMSGYPVARISVNLSPKQFQQDNLLKVISNVLQETGLEAQHLVLEITESVSMQNIDVVIKTMQELNDLGIQVSIDDFGTGYSSLLYLKRFPIQSLKIDRTFIRDITSNPDAAKIALAVIAMAHSLNLTVIAEGVETEEQLQYLIGHECDRFQGYLFSKPLPAEEFEEKFYRNRNWQKSFFF